MFKQYVLFLFFLNATLSFSDLSAGNTYPYQKSQNFDPKHILDDFYFLGDVTVYGNSQDNWQLKDNKNNLIANLKANKLYQLSPTKSATSGKDNAYDDMQKFKIQDGRPLTFILNSTNKNLPQVRILFEKNQNLIALYIGNPSRTGKVTVKDSEGKEHTESITIPAKGFKIIFDINKFRDYLTQTFFYKIMLANFKYPIVGFGLGFSIDPTKIALINTSDATQVLSLLNIKLIFKAAKGTAPIPILSPKAKDTYYDSEPLAIQEKIHDKNYTEQIKYADLFGIGAIKVEPLASADAKKIDTAK